MLPIPDTLSSGGRPPEFKVSGMGSIPKFRGSGGRMPPSIQGVWGVWGGEAPPGVA